VQVGVDLKTGKKRKLKKAFWCWLLIDLVVVLVILILLLHKPARYNPPVASSASNQRGQDCPYLTHELSPQLYNGVQQGEPFDLVVTQEGVNEIIAWSEWPKQSEGIIFSAPMVLFVPDRVVLMVTADVKGVGFVITIVVEPTINEEGLLNLRVAKLKVGAMNVTPLARIIARSSYEQRFAMGDIDSDDLSVRIAASLLNNEPFEPVFELEDKKARVEKITIEQEKLTVHLVPASN
jgi:uncharacterized protein YpmS